MNGKCLAAPVLFAALAWAGASADEEAYPAFLREFQTLLKKRAYDAAAQLAEGCADDRARAHAGDARLLKGYLDRALTNAARATGNRVKLCGISGTLVKIEGEELTLRARGAELTMSFARLRADELIALAELHPPPERFAMRGLFYYAEGDIKAAAKELRGARRGKLADRARWLMALALRDKEERAAKPADRAKPTRERVGKERPTEGVFGSRTPEGRRECIEAYGGSKATEAAVEAALRWLAAHQEDDGRWDGESYEGINADPGITGLAVLAFLGAGYTQAGGMYEATVGKAVEWIISQPDADGCIGRGFKGSLGYHHAICGLALAEDYGMTNDGGVKRAAQKAVNYSVYEHQCPGSGWRYTAKQPADTSVTGWFVMQLKSAEAAGLKVPASGFRGATSYLDSVTTRPDAGDPFGGRLSYTEGRNPSITMTSVGMVCRFFTGWNRRTRLLVGGAEWVMSKPPDWGQANFYRWYYATIAMFQMGGRYWEGWNAAMTDALIPNQVKGGDEDGSWHPVGGGGVTQGGRVMATAMGAMCLEAYYRYARAGE